MDKENLFKRLRSAMGVSTIKDMTPKEIDDVFQSLHDKNVNLSEQLAKANERVSNLVSAIENLCVTHYVEYDAKNPAQTLDNVLNVSNKWALDTSVSYDAAKFALEQKIEAFEKAQIPRHAKAGCIGEFKFTLYSAGCCPHCWEDPNDDCDLCRGESGELGIYDLEAIVPWDLCKSIWLRMNKIYAEQLRKEQDDVET